MKEIKIKIYGWSDFKKWFWDKFCFPRRRVVVEWLDIYGDALRSSVEAILLKYTTKDLAANNFEELHNALKELDGDRFIIQKKVEERIMEEK